MGIVRVVALLVILIYGIQAATITKVPGLPVVGCNQDEFSLNVTASSATSFAATVNINGPGEFKQTSLLGTSFTISYDATGAEVLVPPVKFVCTGIGLVNISFSGVQLTAPYSQSIQCRGKILLSSTASSIPIGGSTQVTATLFPPPNESSSLLLSVQDPSVLSVGHDVVSINPSLGITTFDFPISNSQVVSNPVPPTFRITGSCKLDTRSNPPRFKCVLGGNSTYLATVSSFGIYNGNVAQNGNLLYTISPAPSGTVSIVALPGYSVKSQLADLLNQKWYIQVDGNRARGQILRNNLIESYNLNFSPGQEVPPPGQADATGSGLCQLNVETEPPTLACYVEHNVLDPSAAHIHIAEIGLAGPIIYIFNSPKSPIMQVFQMKDTAQFTVDQQIRAIRQFGAYLNVHSFPYPSGALRSQLVRDVAVRGVSGYGVGTTSVYDTITGGCFVNLALVPPVLDCAFVANLNGGVPSSVVISRNGVTLYTFPNPSDPDYVFTMADQPTATVQTQISDLLAGKVQVIMYRSPGVVAAQATLTPENYRFEISAAGIQEVPQAGQIDGFGIGYCDINTINVPNLITCYFAHNVFNPTAGYLRWAPNGQSGPIIYTFPPPPTSPIQYTFVMQDKVINGNPYPVSAQIEDIIKSQWYLDIKNADFPAGAVRGQLHPAFSFNLAQVDSFVFSDPEHGVPGSTTVVVDPSNPTEYCPAFLAISVSGTLKAIGPQTCVGVGQNTTVTVILQPSAQYDLSTSVSATGGVVTPSNFFIQNGQISFPVTFTAQQVGTATVGFSVSGYGSTAVSFQVQGGITTTLPATLTQGAVNSVFVNLLPGGSTNGPISVTATSSNAVVTSNPVNIVGKTDVVEVVGTSPGAGSITWSAPGYCPLTQTFQVGNGLVCNNNQVQNINGTICANCPLADNNVCDNHGTCHYSRCSNSAATCGCTSEWTGSACNFKAEFVVQQPLNINSNATVVLSDLYERSGFTVYYYYYYTYYYYYFSLLDIPTNLTFTVPPRLYTQSTAASNGLLNFIAYDPLDPYDGEVEPTNNLPSVNGFPCTPTNVGFTIDAVCNDNTELGNGCMQDVISVSGKADQEYVTDANFVSLKFYRWTGTTWQSSAAACCDSSKVYQNLDINTREFTTTLCRPGQWHLYICTGNANVLTPVPGGPPPPAPANVGSRPFEPTTGIGGVLPEEPAQPLFPPNQAGLPSHKIVNNFDNFEDRVARASSLLSSLALTVFAALFLLVGLF